MAEEIGKDYLETLVRTELFRLMADEHRQRSQFITGKVRDETSLSSDEWPPLARLFNTSTYKEILDIAESGWIVGSFVPALLHPTFLDAYFLDFTQSETGKKVLDKSTPLDTRRCPDLDLMTTASLEDVASQLEARNLKLKRINLNRQPWKGEKELYEGPRLEITSDDNREIATIFGVVDENSVKDWLKTRAFSDEMVALSFEAQNPLVKVIDPTNALGKVGQPNYYFIRGLNPQSKYARINPEASFDILTKLAKVSPREAEKGKSFLPETKEFVLNLLKRYFQTREKMDEITEKKLRTKIAASVGRCFATDPVIATHLFLVTHTPLLGIFSPTLAEEVGWNLENMTLSDDEKFSARQRQIIHQFLNFYGEAFFSDRDYPQFSVSTTQKYPESLKEILNVTLTALEINQPIKDKIENEFRKNWPEITETVSRWIPIEASTNFNFSVK